MKLDLEKVGTGLFFGGGLAYWYHFELGVYIIGIGVFCLVMANACKKKEPEEEEEPIEAETYTDYQQPEVFCKYIDGKVMMIDSNGNILRVAEPNERKRIGSNK